MYAREEQGRTVIFSRGLTSRLSIPVKLALLGLPTRHRNPSSSRGIRGFVWQNPTARGGRAPRLLEERRDFGNAEKAE